MAVVLLSIGLVATFFILMSVRILFVRNGEFRGTCASQSPWLNKEGVACGYCGKTLSAGETCGREDPEPLPEIKRKPR
ncbi:MAG TPA: hypothetical protein VF191_08525 [Cyclobacteriaceae bacterium]